MQPMAPCLIALSSTLHVLRKEPARAHGVEPPARAEPVQLSDSQLADLYSNTAQELECLSLFVADTKENMQ